MRLRRRHHAHVFEGVSRAWPAVTAVPFRAKKGQCKETKNGPHYIGKGQKEMHRNKEKTEGWKQAGKE